jgi:hypothetical protein
MNDRTDRAQPEPAIDVVSPVLRLRRLTDGWLNPKVGLARRLIIVRVLRAAMALVIAPLLGALLYAAAASLFGGYGYSGQGEKFWLLPQAVCYLALIFCAAVAIAAFLLRAFRLKSLAGLGAIFAALAVLVFVMSVGEMHPISLSYLGGIFLLLFVAAVCGSAQMAVFYALAAGRWPVKRYGPGMAP